MLGYAEAAPCGVDWDTVIVGFLAPTDAMKGDGVGASPAFLSVLEAAIKSPLPG